MSGAPEGDRGYYGMMMSDETETALRERVRCVVAFVCAVLECDRLLCVRFFISSHICSLTSYYYYYYAQLFIDADISKFAHTMRIKNI